MKYRSMAGRKLSISPEQFGELCELFISGQMTIFQLATKYKLSVTTIDRYLDKFYYGFVPKKYHLHIKLSSKMNTDDP
jgi:hypothetical protein